MHRYTDRTILVSAPKRSGGTLLTRLFDAHPGVIDFIDEAFFWEHAHHYHSIGQEALFVDAFKTFSPKEILVSLIDRQMLPWVDGTYRQIAPKKTSFNMGLDRKVFLDTLRKHQNELVDMHGVWDMLVGAYAQAMGYDMKTHRKVSLFGGDYGRAMLTAKQTLPDSRNIFIIRNPFFALDSLKKSRLSRGEKVLHPINFIQSMSFYFFFWKNRKDILNEDTLLVRYEDLLSDPKSVMQKVAAHVDVPFSENLLTPTMRGKIWGGDSSFGELKGIDKSVLNRKIQTLDEREILLIKTHLRPILEHFDYSV